MSKVVTNAVFYLKVIQVILKCYGFLSFFKLIYFWLRWVFVAARGLSLVAASGGYSSLWCAGFSLRWLVFVVEHRL